MCALALICCNDRSAEFFVAQDVRSGIQMLIVLPNLCQIIKQEHYKIGIPIHGCKTHDYTNIASPHTWPSFVVSPLPL